MRTCKTQRLSCLETKIDFMRRLGVSARSPISNIRHFIIIMSSQALGSQGSFSQQCRNGIHRYRCHCNKAPLVRTVASSCASSGHEKTSDETQDHKKLGKEVLQWDKLSEDEKNMYFAHKHACMVRLLPENRYHWCHCMAFNIL